MRELNNVRPLLPSYKSFKNENPKVHEVLETFRMAAATGPDALGAYVISMAHHPSDVLAVELLQKEVGARPTHLPWSRAPLALACSSPIRPPSSAPRALCSVQAGAQRHLRVVPLFETKADLEEAGKTIKALLDIDWYHKVGCQ